MSEEKNPNWQAYKQEMDSKDSLSSDPVVNQVIEVILNQERKGLNKYSATISEAKLSETELINHAIEESIDLAVYLQALKAKLKEKSKELNIEELNEELAKISYGQSNWALVAKTTRDFHRETARRIKDYLIGANII